MATIANIIKVTENCLSDFLQLPTVVAMTLSKYKLKLKNLINKHAANLYQTTNQSNKKLFTRKIETIRSHLSAI